MEVIIHLTEKPDFIQRMINAAFSSDIVRWRLTEEITNGDVGCDWNHILPSRLCTLFTTCEKCQLRAEYLSPKGFDPTVGF